MDVDVVIITIDVIRDVVDEVGAGASAGQAKQTRPATRDCEAKVRVKSLCTCTLHYADASRATL